MGSIFRRVRIAVFVSVTIVSLVLTVFYALLISKDFSRYTKLQRGIVAASVALDGITAILMYLMLAVRYSIKLDAMRIIVLLGLQTASTTLFTLRVNDIPCNAFKGGAMCRQAAWATAILSWVLCGLLVVYGACLVIMAFVPHPPPILDLEPELDIEVPVNAQTRHVTRLSISGARSRVNSGAANSPYSTELLLGDPVNSPIYDVRQEMRQQQGLQPIGPIGSRYHPNYLPAIMPVSDPNVPYWPSRRGSADEGRPSQPLDLYADTISRTWTASSIYTIGEQTSSDLFPGVRSETLSPPPPPAQPKPTRRSPTQRTRHSMSTLSVYSTSGEWVEIPPPVPSLATHRTASESQSTVRSMASASASDLGRWKQLVLDAAAGRRSESY